MNKASVWGVLVVIVIVVAGLLAWQAAGPDTQLVPTATLTPLAITPTFVPVQGSPPTFPPPVSPSPLTIGSPVTSVPPQAGTTISLTDTGFAPASVTVSAGSVVSFINNGQAMHWPASDIHPTHQLLPGFDAKRGLATGETYFFTFVKPGSWHCHDHLNPQFTCTVVVE